MQHEPYQARQQLYSNILKKVRVNPPTQRQSCLMTKRENSRLALPL
jgi:hypothetical protein